MSYSPSGRRVQLVATQGSHQPSAMNGGEKKDQTYEFSISRNNPHMRSSLHKNQFIIIIAVFQAFFLVAFSLFGSYDEAALPGGHDKEANERGLSMYPMFQDTHTMIFIGFGFLMTYLKRYGFSAVSINLLMGSFVIQWSIIVRGIVHHNFHSFNFTIGLEQLLTADFAAAVVLISMGAMLGKLSPIQYIIMAFIEVPVAIIVEHYLVTYFKINDVGGSIVVHTFGAYFGLGVSRAFAKKAQRDNENEGSAYHTDIFAMVGAIFLWVYWPSFNAAVAHSPDSRHRAIANTVLALSACTLTTFLMSQLVDKHKRVEMVHVANSTLAGGVAVGTTANVILEPSHALFIGILAGIISVLGYNYITPFLSSKIGIHDTCGVHNLHGMPGVLAGLASIVILLCYDLTKYGDQLSLIYPGMEDPSFDAHTQALHQFFGLFIVIAISIISGLITGALLKLKLFDQVRDSENFADGDYFHTPPDYDFTSKIVSNLDRVQLDEYKPIPQKEA